MQFKDYFKKKHTPLTVAIELTHRCSFDCVHCYLPKVWRKPASCVPKKERGELTTQQVQGVLTQLAACGTLFVSFTGGEIFLRKDLNEIVGFAAQAGFSIRLFTNGYHLTESWADKIRDFGIYAVEVSLYGASEKTYRSVTGVKGAFSRVFAGIAMLRERNIRTVVKTPILKGNVDDILRISQMVEEQGASWRTDLVLYPRLDGDPSPQTQRLEEREIEKVFEQLQADFSRVRPHEGRVGQCGVGRWAAAISPLGEVYPCLDFRTSLGNVRHQSFQDIWNQNEVLEQIRRTLDQAPPDPTCFGDGFCGHCPAFSQQTTGDMTKASCEHLRIAAVKRKYSQRARDRIQSSGACHEKQAG